MPLVNTSAIRHFLVSFAHADQTFHGMPAEAFGVAYAGKFLYR
jgi:hypothetical protein